MFLGRLCFSFRGLDSTVAMLRWRVERVQLQRLVASILDIVPRAGRNNDSGIALDLYLVAIDLEFTVAFLHAEELVPVSVDLFANLFPWFKCHQNELHGLAGVEHMPKIRILFGQILE
jgi:hypothetical protein